MKRKDINNALKARLAAGTSLTGTWPGVEPQGAMARPYFEVLFPAQDRMGRYVSADVIEETGRMAVVIVTEFGTGETEANGIAEAVGDLFPQGLRIAITGGTITIEQPADLRGGYRDERDWRVPVIIRYHAINS